MKHNKTLNIVIIIILIVTFVIIFAPKEEKNSIEINNLSDIEEYERKFIEEDLYDSNNKFFSGIFLFLMGLALSGIFLIIFMIFSFLYKPKVTEENDNKEENKKKEIIINVKE
jgi:preprotein translocase subunit SecG